MGNMIVDGRRFVAASGTGESSDPYLPATTDYLDSQIYTVTFTVDTSALADGDLAANPVEIASAVRAAGGVSNLRSIFLVDKSDQKSALYVVFSNASTSLGTLNSAPSISDANIASAIIGHVKIAATDYVDLGGGSVATKVLDNPLPLKAAADSTSLWVSLVSNGTPTYGAASDVIATFTFARS